MPRIRAIKPQFWEDEKIGQLSYRARLLYVGIWNFADDEGVVIWRPEYLRSRIFPYDDIPLNEVKSLQDELVGKNLLYPYESNGDNYAVVLTFRKHQVINRPVPSRLPAPNWENSKYKDAIFKRDHYLCSYCGHLCQAHNPQEAQTLGLSIDHIIPRSKGGNDYPGNLTTACASCNKQKHDKSVNVHGGLTEHSGTEKEKEKEKEKEVRASPSAPRPRKTVNPSELLKLKTDTALMAELQRRFPLAFQEKDDLFQECVEFWQAKGNLKVPRLAIRNWFRIAQERKERRANGTSQQPYAGNQGTPRHPSRPRALPQRYTRPEDYTP